MLLLISLHQRLTEMEGRTDACLKKFPYNRDVKKKKEPQDSDVPTLSGEMPMKSYCRWYDLPFYNLQAFYMYSGRQQRGSNKHEDYHYLYVIISLKYKR